MMCPNCNSLNVSLKKKHKHYWKCRNCKAIITKLQGGGLTFHFKKIAKPQKKKKEGKK